MLATVASSNSAHRIQYYLAREASVSTKVIQTPSALAKEGCGYSLRFESRYKPKVIETAKKLRINIRAFYTEKTDDGKTSFVKE